MGSLPLMGSMLIYVSPDGLIKTLCSSTVGAVGRDPAVLPRVIAILVEGHAPQDGADHEGSDLGRLLLHGHGHPETKGGW